jgi:hypothetical protein
VNVELVEGFEPKTSGEVDPAESNLKEEKA